MTDTPAPFSDLPDVLKRHILAAGNDPSLVGEPPKVGGVVAPPSVIDRLVHEVMQELGGDEDDEFVKRILLIHLAIEDALRREANRRTP